MRPHGHYAEYYGGGIFGGTLYDCVLAGNDSGRDDGGGASDATLYDCIVRDNFAADEGGGLYNSTAYRCLIEGNDSPEGGGVLGGTTTASISVTTRASTAAAPAWQQVVDCLLYGNHANAAAGAARLAFLYNCTVVSNSATGAGGGTYSTRAWNSVIWGNTAPVDANWGPASYSNDLHHSCTTPLPGPDGNITNDPAFVDAPNGDYRISVSSPCFNAGSNEVVTTSVDLDGNPRIAGRRVDMGAYEEPATTRYVDDATARCAVPYTNPPCRANIQAAIDVSEANDLILVSAGTYDSGTRIVDGSMKNRVVIDKPVTVRGVGSREDVIIKGQGPLGDNAIRCVYMVEGATLEGVTLTNGFTRMAGDMDTERSGGGLYAPTSSGTIISNCVLAGNFARQDGGGAFRGTLYDCVVADNTADSDDGGGVAHCTLYDCIVRDNSGAGRGRRHIHLNGDAV